MRNLLRKLVPAIALLVGASICPAQTIAPSSLTYTWPSVAGTGQLGSYLIFSGTNVARPANYNVDWTVSGTAPSICTFDVEGSSDGVNWFALDSAAVSCTASTAKVQAFSYVPVLYMRINIDTYTAGDGTTKVVFHYTGQNLNP